MSIDEANAPIHVTERQRAILALFVAGQTLCCKQPNALAALYGQEARDFVDTSFGFGVVNVGLTHEGINIGLLSQRDFATYRSGTLSKEQARTLCCELFIPKHEMNCASFLAANFGLKGSAAATPENHVGQLAIQDPYNGTPVVQITHAFVTSSAEKGLQMETWGRVLLAEGTNNPNNNLCHVPLQGTNRYRLIGYAND